MERSPSRGLVSLLSGLLALLAACGGDSSSAPPASDLSCAARPDRLCGNALNEVLLPMLRAQGQTPRTAAPEELCRRLAVDFLGRIPTEAELDDCLNAAPEDILDSWMSSAEYQAVQQRFWASELGFDVVASPWWQVFDLDERVGALARGEIRYDQLATAAITHPAFFAPRFDDGWAAGVFNVFLGRPARRDEMDGLRPLAEVFAVRPVCDGRMAELGYQFCLQLQASGELEGVECEAGCTLVSYEGAIDPCGCTSEVAGLGCYGTGLGEPIDLGVASCGAAPTDLRRIIERSAGDANRCPDFGIDCRDIALDLDDEVILHYTGEPAAPLAEVDADLRQRLAAIGAVLVGRGDFWETAADRELRRLLGWWQSGFRQPDYAIPAVRTVLAKLLRDSGDLRAAQKLIATSLLYTAPAGAVDTALPTDPPPWSAGPRKALVAESWLESAQVVVGESLGICDHRFIAADWVGAASIAELTNQGRREASTLPENAPAFAELAASLGGCQQGPRPSAADIASVFQQGQIANLLCGLGGAVLPPDFAPADASDAALRSAAARLVGRAFARRPAAAELDGLVGDMRACLHDGACADAEVAARWLCARLIDSTAFGIY